jgi:hypothetical protein
MTVLAAMFAVAPIGAGRATSWWSGRRVNPEEDAAIGRSSPPSSENRQAGFVAGS